LSVRLTTALLVASVLLAYSAIAFVGYRSAMHATRTDAVVARELEHMSLYQEARSAALDESRAVAVYEARPGASNLHDFEGAQAAVDSHLAALEAIMRARPTAPHDLAAVQLLQAQHAQLADSNLRVVMAIEGNDQAAAYAITNDGDLASASRAFLDALTAHSDDESGQMLEAQRVDATARARAKWLLIGIAGACALVMLAAGLGVFWWVARPVEHIGLATRRIAAGELSVTAPESGPKEIHRLGADVNVMATALIARTEELTAHLSSNLASRTAELEYLASHDPLTGLFNSQQLRMLLARQLSDAAASAGRGAVVFLDLDQFKDVNDSLGHKTGDELLIQVAGVLRSQVREVDVLGRIGGDEFAVVMPDLNAEEAWRAGWRLVRAVDGHQFAVGQHMLTITTSVGIALFPEHGNAAGELLSRADMAMYQSKKDGRNRAHGYTQELESAVTSRRSWHDRVRHALAADSLVLYAQPIVDLASGEITQYELLLRMEGEGGEVILPGAFLDLVEGTALMQEIDRWVIRRAIRTIAESSEHGRPLRVEANLSGRAFTDPELLPMIRAELAATHVDPAYLILEVTESAAILDFERARAFIAALKDVGCQFALDDFGVGFSSLNRLKQLPVDYLKIDGSFISNLSRSAVDQQLVQAIVGMARALGKKTIAEFVEDRATLDLLRDYGVDYGQGFFIARPAPMATFAAEERSAA
jgi:diguanylate cyclase (GGDEF)-like protein